MAYGARLRIGWRWRVSAASPRDSNSLPSAIPIANRLASSGAGELSPIASRGWMNTEDLTTLAAENDNIGHGVPPRFRVDEDVLRFD